jgi:AcrR family transcriptional regulator
MNSGTVDLVDEQVKRRTYRSPKRAARAARTRHDILEAARTLFTGRGYAATTMAQVADRAGVAIDTVYASVGTKPELLRLLLEGAIAGGDEAVPAEERAYVHRIRAATTAQAKLAIYGQALAEILPRLAPLESVIDEAAPAEPEIAALRSEIHDRRARNMRHMAQDLARTGQLRPDLSLDEVADILWTTNSAAVYDLLMSRPGWTPQRYGAWLGEAWARLFLTDPA